MSKSKRTGKSGEGAGPVEAGAFQEGDLRAVELHAAALEKGNMEAAQALQALGRDAAGLLFRLADERNSDDLRAFAKRLIAVPPQVKTNLMTLRALSVMDLVTRALSSGPNATDIRDFEVPGNAVAIFDPHRVSEAIVRGGRPRREVQRVSAGDIAWFGIEGRGPISVSLLTAPPPEGQPARSVRLRVESGVVFVGPPEAADGPRLGEVRLDPFRTNLHQHLGQGRLARLKPNTYVAQAHRDGQGTIRIHLVVDPDPGAEPVPVDLGTLMSIPGQI